MAFDFESVLTDVCKMPFVKVDRLDYLKKAFGKYCDASVLDSFMYSGPGRAGIPAETVDKVADEAIRQDTLRTTSISAAAGIPGGLAVLGTMPADLAQYIGHVLIILQKLAYIYGWPDLTGTDVGTRALIILFAGIMFGSSSANKAVGKVAKSAAVNFAKQLPKVALTKTFMFPIIKQVCNFIGVKMTKDIFAKSVGRIVPLVGALVSGGMTYASFKPMAKRLKNYLRTLPQAKPVNALMMPVCEDDDFSDDGFLQSKPVSIADEGTAKEMPASDEIKPINAEEASEIKPEVKTDSALAKTPVSIPLSSESSIELEKTEEPDEIKPVAKTEEVLPVIAAAASSSEHKIDLDGIAAVKVMSSPVNPPSVDSNGNNMEDDSLLMYL